MVRHLIFVRVCIRGVTQVRVLAFVNLFFIFLFLFLFFLSQRYFYRHIFLSYIFLSFLSLFFFHYTSTYTKRGKGQRGRNMNTGYTTKTPHEKWIICMRKAASSLSEFKRAELNAALPKIVQHFPEMDEERWMIICLFVGVFSSRWNFFVLRFMINSLPVGREFFDKVLFPFHSWILSSRTEKTIILRAIPLGVILKSSSLAQEEFAETRIPVFPLESFVVTLEREGDMKRVCSHAMESIVVFISRYLTLTPITQWNSSVSSASIKPPTLFKSCSSLQRREEFFGDKLSTTMFLQNSELEDKLLSVIATNKEDKEKQIMNRLGKYSAASGSGRLGTVADRLTDYKNQELQPPCMRRLSRGEFLKGKRHPNFNERTAILLFFSKFEGDDEDIMRLALKPFHGDGGDALFDSQIQSFLGDGTKNGGAYSGGCSFVKSLGCCTFYNTDIEDCQNMCFSGKDMQGLEVRTPNTYFVRKRESVEKNE